MTIRPPLLTLEREEGGNTLGLGEGERGSHWAHNPKEQSEWVWGGWVEGELHIMRLSSGGEKGKEEGEGGMGGGWDPLLGG